MERQESSKRMCETYFNTCWERKLDAITRCHCTMDGSKSAIVLCAHFILKTVRIIQEMEGGNYKQYNASTVIKNDCNVVFLSSWIQSTFWILNNHRILFAWPVKVHHIVKWDICMVWYPLGCSHCRWVNHLHYPCLQKHVLNIVHSWAVVHTCSTLDKLPVCDDDDRSHFPMEGSEKLPNMALIISSRSGHVAGRQVIGLGVCEGSCCTKRCVCYIE